MEVAYIKTPLGVAKLEGDADGLSAITVLDNDEKVTDLVPEVLEDAAYQLNEYFEGTRKRFDLTLNPEGTRFSAACLGRVAGDSLWQDRFLFGALQNIGRCKGHTCRCRRQWQKSAMDRGTLSPGYWQRWFLNRICRRFAP